MTICLASAASAQTPVSGIVIDDRTEKPIKGVLVYVEHQAVFAETDDDGRFSLSVPRGQHTITASVIGYALLQTDIDVAAAPIDLTFRLSEGAGAYTERLTVSGSLRAESDSVPGSTSLHGRELENLRGAVLDDPLRALQSLPAATATDD
ncbi:MAG TPA: carboxypeptidase-like regulatory domain-containing protein, partial [Vicinamibacterales bacterium]|nr:carboxypeptidase-like regulatory domain-containing protein [Vicinamibacterales bacterium]